MDDGNPRTEKNTLPEGALLAIIMFFVLIGILALVFLRLSGEGTGPENPQYATGAEYTVTGKIVKAEEISVAGKRHFDVEIETQEEMPDGTHIFASKQRHDYKAVFGYAKHPEVWVTLTISERGIIRNVEKAAEK